ncbi:MAG: hypothetical protein OXQ86_12615 [Gammaproteobacteria bacterium]|nr:hypothetical protein [Gammaproteobacteria bacterium]MDE0414316.1 hypothetical protein [Gammaproteobacteria bacterium]
MLLVIVEAFVWLEFLGLPEPFPGQAEHPWFHLHAAAWLGLTALGHKLTRGWLSGSRERRSVRSRLPENDKSDRDADFEMFEPRQSSDGPAPTAWRKGPVLLCVVAAFVLGATTIRVWEVLSQPGEPRYASVSESIERIRENVAVSGGQIRGSNALSGRQTRESAERNGSDQAEPTIDSLTEALNQGQVEILFVNGKGHSTGAILDAFLINPSQQERRFQVQLDQPVYYRNQGVGQNMLVTRVLGDQGEFWRNDETSYFAVEAGTDMVPIVLWGYCVDFEKDNPNSMEILEAGNLPFRLREIAHRIAAFEETNAQLDVDLLMQASQVALWQAQGVTLDRIQRRFHISGEALLLAREIAKYD